MKYTIKTKDFQLIVRAKAAWGEKFDGKALDAFGRLYLRGFLQPKIVNKSLVEYSGPIAIPLCERLKKPVTKYEFFHMMEQIIAAVQKVQNNDMSMNKLVMDVRHVFINEVTKEMQFLYVPLVGENENAGVISFIESIVYSVVPAAEERDRDFVSRFIYFVKAQKGFKPDLIEKYIAKEESSVVELIKKQNVGQSGFMTSKQKHYYEHYEDKLEGQGGFSGFSGDDELTGLLREGDEDGTSLLESEGSEETSLLISEEDGTTLLEENQVVHYPTLRRLSTDETVEINKPVFRVGKERSYVDYFVANNNAVSRNHADIITRGSKYFVTDLNSKNHTYINDQMIAVQCETEIRDGDRLKLGNEEFIFNV